MYALHWQPLSLIRMRSRVEIQDHLHRRAHPQVRYHAHPQVRHPVRHQVRCPVLQAQDQVHHQVQYVSSRHPVRHQEVFRDRLHLKEILRRYVLPAAQQAEDLQAIPRLALQAMSRKTVRPAMCLPDDLREILRATVRPEMYLQADRQEIQERLQDLTTTGQSRI